MRTKRGTVLVVASAVAHLMLLAAIFLARPPKGPEGRPGAMVVSLYDGEMFMTSPSPPQAATALVEPSPPVVEREIVERPPADVEPIFVDTAPPNPEFAEPPDPTLKVAEFVAAAAAASPGQPGEACPLAMWIQDALRAEPGVTAGLSVIPRQSRSVANAIMLWDGDWVAAKQPAAEAGLAPIRAAIVAGVEAAPASCREQRLNGPLLITLIGERDTTLLVIGSGEWKWADVQPAVQPEPEPSLLQGLGRLFNRG